VAKEELVVLVAPVVLAVKEGKEVSFIFFKLVIQKSDSSS